MNSILLTPLQAGAFHFRNRVVMSPLTRARAFKSLALEVRRMRRLNSINGRKYAMERVASFLVSLADDVLPPGNLAVPISRGEIAEYIGLTIESVSRCVSKLKREKILGKERGDFMQVLDWPCLRKLAHGVDAGHLISLTPNLSS